MTTLHGYLAFPGFLENLRAELIARELRVQKFPPLRFPDWIFSDVISEPRKILELVQRWLIVHPDASYVCSVKFKGETDFRVMAALQRIKGSFVIHLNQNKHEVTWVRLGPTMLP